ncbi:unnamed protein product [Candidula unifasciata]|uniref:Uncharacterized protein n=1 Tax=Candidula unifasciata TaxID=100452 RepID=A0A8S3ZFM2_9EUPU|nr:unnamed protein product [Candidula unifasciata]
MKQSFDKYPTIADDTHSLSAHFYLPAATGIQAGSCLRLFVLLSKIVCCVCNGQCHTGALSQLFTGVSVLIRRPFSLLLKVYLELSSFVACHEAHVAFSKLCM